MRRLLLVHRAGETGPEQRELAGPGTAGGSRADALPLAGLPPGALRLEPCAAGVVIEAAAAGVRVAGRPVPPGGRRLLRPGERAELRGLSLELPREPTVTAGTRAIAAGILRQASDGSRPVAGPHLLVLTGVAAGERLPLGPEQTLGRSRRARIRIADPAASRLHARLRVDPRGATVQDLGAKNGLRVNGVRLDGRERALGPGDELEIGGTAVALVLAERCGASEAQGGPPVSRPGGDAPAARGADARRAAAALLALSALALALAGT